MKISFKCLLVYLALAVIFISATSLRSAPLVSSSAKRSSPVQYSTKIKHSQYFHHHYIYHGSQKKRKRKEHDHDHEIKIPTDERISKLYHMVDINRDGIVSKKELQSLLHIHKYPEHHPKHNDLIETALNRLDLNSDGIIEKEEYLYHMKQSTQHLSEQLRSSTIPKEHLVKLESLI
eukprot:152997_1